MTMTTTLRQRGTRRQRTTAGRAVAAAIRAGLTVLCVLVLLCVPRFAAAQEPPAPQAVPAAQLQAAIDKLGDLDYATRSNAARTVRRVPASQAVPVLLQTVAEHADGYVRYRALVLLTGFNDPRTKDAMREAVTSPNDRLRTVAYSFFEHNPDRTMVSAAARRARQGAGGVRPAGARPGARGARPGAVGSRIGVRVGSRPAGAGAGRESRGGFFSQRRDRVARRLQGGVCLRRHHRQRHARRPAPGRCRAGAGKDRRQTRARDAGRLAAHRRARTRSRRSRRRSACSASIAPATKSI